MSQRSASPLQTTITEAWRGRGALSCALWPLSLLYGFLVRVRQGLYLSGLRPQWQAPVPLVVVGNVIAGGAGKTPLVIALVEHLRARGLRPGVISRGYGRTSVGCQLVTSDRTPQEVGDEPLLIHLRTGVPMAVDADRKNAAQTLLAHDPTIQVLISDDGLQHLALHRDIEICVFDDRGIGNGWLLPAGPLREPWPRYVDLVLHTGARPAFTGYTSHRALAPYAVGKDGQRMALADLRLAQPPIVAVAAIANPQSFFDMLKAEGLHLQLSVALPDHADYSTWARPPIADAVLLCTEKDARKIWEQHPDAWAVPLMFSPQPEFFAALDRLVDDLVPTRPLSSDHG